MTVSNPDALYQIACCLRQAAGNILEEHDLPVPERGFPTHKGPDYECEDCESLWVWIEDTVPSLTFADDGKCSNPLTRTFIVELAYPVCTESISPCDEQPGCQEYEPQDGDGGVPPCWKVEPKLGGGKCSEKDRPTIQQESAAIWRARYVLEQELACAAQCCVQECGNGRCRSVELGFVSESVEGGCAFLTFSLQVTW